MSTIHHFTLGIMIYHPSKRIVFKSSKTIYSDGSMENTTFTTKVANPYLRNKVVCIRCGRNSHKESSCYARTHLEGHSLSDIVQPDYDVLFPEDIVRSGVYVLSLNDGKYHIGQSTNIDETIDLFASGCGSEWSNHHGVICEVAPTTSQCSSMDNEDWEKKETMELAIKYGMSNVRGYRWSGLYLDPEEFHDFETRICESKRLCKNCGRSHDISTCNASSRSIWMRM